MVERSRQSPSLAASVVMVALLVLLAAPPQARAGGQGQGLPDPDFVTSFDPDFVFGAMNTSQVGAPAPRWVRRDAPATACSDPQLGLPDPFGRLTVVDGVGSTDVCIPDFVPGASLPGKVRATSVSGDEVLVDEGDPSTTDDDVFQRQVSLTLTLSVVLTGGEVQVQSLVVPPSTFTRRASDNTFLSRPPLVQEVGWFDGGALCSGGLVLDAAGVQRISVERIAAGSSQTGDFPSIGVNGLNRAALVALGQKELPALLCQPNGAGACTFTPALVFVDPDGTLSEPTNEIHSGDGKSAECDVTLRFAKPAGADPGQCEADLGVCRDDLAECLANPPLADADGDGEADATDRCAGTPAGEAVDDAGCSAGQFCAQFDVQTTDGRKSCRRADWRNDEPSESQQDGDCRVAKDVGTKRERCVPAP